VIEAQFDSAVLALILEVFPFVDIELEDKTSYKTAIIFSATVIPDPQLAAFACCAVDDERVLAEEDGHDFIPELFAGKDKFWKWRHC